MGNENIKAATARINIELYKIMREQDLTATEMLSAVLRSSDKFITYYLSLRNDGLENTTLKEREQ